MPRRSLDRQTRESRVQVEAGERRSMCVMRSLSLYLQSRCFFLGPIISSVVALQTDLARPWPAMLCLAANSLSLIVCPAILSHRVTEYRQPTIHVYDDFANPLAGNLFDTSGIFAL